jgi:carboxymethylenebutenolidase
MIERETSVITKYGVQPAFAACPEGPGPFPPVIFYMDAPGMREELRNMARRIAARGYFCLLPDLYYRLGHLRFDIPRRNDAMSVVIRGAMTSLTDAQIVEDTAGMIAFLDAQERVKPGPIGCVGHCMSGSFVAAVAAAFPTRIAAAAALYGIGITTDSPDSPHRKLDRMKAELYFAFAEVDPAVPDQAISDLRDALAKTDLRHTVKVIPGTHHGFQFAARGDYHPVAAEATWDELFALWQRTLS